MSAHKIVTRCLQQLDHIILGKTQQTKLAMCCLLARGHLLIEDLPGMGKTTLSHALASALGLSYRRIQFTNDLLPGDLLGTNIFDKNDGRFHFHPGPIFSNVILADEINRAPPKTQSALLEAMEEHQVTIEGTTRPLPEPFFVIGTQNPSEQAGTYPLPESQLDRFMMRLSLGYPDESAEKKLLMGTDRRKILASTEGVLNPELLLKLQHHISRITAKDTLIDYLYRLIDYSRNQVEHSHGLSPRAGLALLNAARAWAFLEDRSYVIPDDIQTVFPYLAEHRISQHSAHNDHPLSREILRQTSIL
jgi:MoxR-like ATPase